MDIGSWIGLAGTIVGLGAAAIGVWRYLDALYRRTLGSRDDYTERLNKLACGVTMQYVEAIFGTPIFRRNLAQDLGITDEDEEFVEHVYRTPHAWLVVWYKTKDEAAYLFSITVTDPKFRFHTSWLTFDQLDVVLGETRFLQVFSQCCVGRRRETGARNTEYVESYYFGNPGGYAYFLLSYNVAGTGVCDWGGPFPLGPMTWCEGEMPPLFNGEKSSPPSEPTLNILRAMATVNTLTVIAPRLNPSLVAKLPIGVVGDDVRMLRPPRRQGSESRIDRIRHRLRTTKGGSPAGTKESKR